MVSASGAGVRVGNDVVDLSHPRCRSRPPDDRLPGRILTAGERAWLEAAADDQERLLRLWSLWAGKETAFKVASKLRGAPPVFRHREFEVVFDRAPTGGALDEISGRVRWRDLRVPLEGVVASGFVHLVGWGGRGEEVPERPTLEMGVERWGEGRTDPPSGGGGPANRPAASRAAREVARRRLASHLRLHEVGNDEGEDPRIEVVTSPGLPGRSPPRIEVDGRSRPDLDLSLSHHGRYVGWALLLPSADPGAGPGDSDLRNWDGS